MRKLPQMLRGAKSYGVRALCEIPDIAKATPEVKDVSPLPRPTERPQMMFTSLSSSTPNFSFTLSNTRVESS